MPVSIHAWFRDSVRLFMQIMPLLRPIPNSLTVFVPALNEERNLEPTLDQLQKALGGIALDYEIIIVNDGSNDRTGEIADQLAQSNDRLQVIHHPKCLGIGRGYAEAVDTACKSHFVFVPGDNDFLHDALHELFKSMGLADVIISFPTNSHIRPLGRQILSQTYTWVLNFIFGLNVKYYNGLAIFPTAFLRSQPITAFGFGFAAEVLLKAIYSGMSYHELGLKIEERSHGRSKAITLKNIFKVGASVVSCFWKLRIHRKGMVKLRV